MSIKTFLQNYFLPKGHILARATPKDQLAPFFRRMHPKAMQGDLIRIGGTKDGGYLIPAELQGIEACFSPGVARTSDFENHMATLGIPSFMADYSVKSPPIKNDMFFFEKKFLGDTNNNKFMRLEDWVSRNVPDVDKDLLLQMDIEWSEYPVLLDTPETTLRRFRIMAIEFHTMEMLFSLYSFRFIKQVFDKILRDFTIVHIHPNNCCPIVKMGRFEVPRVMEFTFLRNDYFRPSDRELAFPHPLDYRNVERLPDIVLPNCWWKKPGKVTSNP